MKKSTGKGSIQIKSITMRKRIPMEEIYKWKIVYESKLYK